MQVLALGPVLSSLAAWIDSKFAGRPSLLLAFVMVCCPLTMNAAQLVAQDVALKFARAGGGGGLHGPDRQSLIDLELMPGPAAVSAHQSAPG